MRSDGVVWTTIIGLTIGTFVIKAAGPVIFGGRELPALLARIVPLLAPALLAALVVAETFGGSGRSLVLDARAGAVLVAGMGIWRRLPLIYIVVLAAGTAALLRAL